MKTFGLYLLSTILAAVFIAATVAVTHYVEDCSVAHAYPGDG